MPNAQQRSIRLPPDPDPVYDARVANFAVDEKNYLTLKQLPNGQPAMFYGAGRMQAELEHSLGMSPVFDGVGVMAAALLADYRIAPTLDGIGVMDAAPQRGVSLAMLPADLLTTEGGDVLTTEGGDPLAVRLGGFSCTAVFSVSLAQVSP